jgi:hypothetical protein
MLAAASVKAGKPYLAGKALEIAQGRLLEDEWPEYYDGKKGRLIGKQARKYQTWTIAGFLLASELMKDASHLSLVSFEKLPPELISRACEFEIRTVDTSVSL